MQPNAEKNLFRMFEVLLIIRAISACAEIIGGFSFYFLSQKTILHYVKLFIDSEFMGHSKDFITDHLLHWAQNYSISTRNFTFFYLVSHGIVKIWVIIGLLKKILWYYPTAIIIFSLLVSYQTYRFMYTHSIILFGITLIDMIVIGLTWHEYRYLSSQQHS